MLKISAKGKILSKSEKTGSIFKNVLEAKIYFQSFITVVGRPSGT